MTTERYAHIAEKHGFFRATFRLLLTEEGGREQSVTGDYRPNWSIGSPDPQKVGGAPLATDDGAGIELGQTGEVRLYPIWPDFWATVRPGTELFAFEGSKLVGNAVVTEVVPPTGTTNSSSPP